MSALIGTKDKASVHPAMRSCGAMWVMCSDFSAKMELRHAHDIRRFPWYATIRNLDLCLAFDSEHAASWLHNLSAADWKPSQR